MKPGFPGLILISLFAAAPVFAAGSTTSLKLQAFKDSKATLQGDIDVFLKEVDACNPPLGKDRVMGGFGDPKNPDSARTQLNNHDDQVTQDATAAEKIFSDLEQSVSSCVDRPKLLSLASSAGADVQKNFETDRASYKKGIDVANSQRSKLLLVSRPT